MIDWPGRSEVIMEIGSVPSNSFTDLLFILLGYNYSWSTDKVA